MWFATLDVRRLAFGAGLWLVGGSLQFFVLVLALLATLHCLLLLAREEALMAAPFLLL